MPKSPINSKNSSNASDRNPASLVSNSKTKDPDDQLKSFRIRAFTWISGMLVMLGILKFGTPVILQDQLETPKEWIEWIFFAWPMETAYACLLHGS